MTLFMFLWTSLLIEAAQNQPPNPYMRIDGATCSNEQANWINDAVWATREALRVAYVRTLPLNLQYTMPEQPAAQQLSNEVASSTYRTIVSYIIRPEFVVNLHQAIEPVQSRIHALGHLMDTLSGHCEILCNNEWLEPAPSDGNSYAFRDGRSSLYGFPEVYPVSDRHIPDIRQHILAGDDESTATIYRHMPGQYDHAITLSEWPWVFWTGGMQSATLSDGNSFASTTFDVMRTLQYPGYIWELPKLMMFQLMATILQVLQSMQPGFYPRQEPRLDGFLTDALEQDRYTAIRQRASQDPLNTVLYADNILYLIISLYLNNSDWSKGYNRPFSEAMLDWSSHFR